MTMTRRAHPIKWRSLACQENEAKTLKLRDLGVLGNNVKRVYARPNNHGYRPDNRR